MDAFPPHTPPLLDAAGITARIPHRGGMSLLHTLRHWDAQRVHCEAISHQHPDNPLRHGPAPGVLPATAAVEYAAQAMALHGGLLAERDAPGQAPSAGYIASLRGVVLQVPTLHQCPAPLRIQAERLAGDARQVMYRFTLHDGAGALLAEGRATVVLNTPLPAATAAATPSP